jgi:hypothetical protein
MAINKLIIENSSGNVGIGTTNPLDSLHIHGGNAVRIKNSSTYARLDLGTANNRFFVQAEGGVFNGWGIYQDDPSSGAGWKLVVNTAGNVGVGLTNPYTRLHVTGGAIGQSTTDFVVNSAGTIVYMRTGASTGNTYGLIQAANTGDTVGASLVLNQFGGNVGIGTTNPYSQLHLTGDVTMGSGSNARPAFKISNWGYSSGYRVLMIGSASNTYTTSNTGAVTVAFNYDPSSNPNGSFTGDGGEILFRRGTRFLTPNAADTGFDSSFILSDGQIDLVGGKIKFPATQVASSDANTLDDYEEGTYTPTVVVSSGTPTYDYQEGYYTKIGRQVFGGGIIGISNSNALSGTISVSLPFTIAAGTFGYTGGAVSDGSGWTFPIGSGYYSVFLHASPGNAHLDYIGVGSSAAAVSYTASGVGSSWYFRFSFSIRV